MEEILGAFSPDNSIQLFREIDEVSGFVAILYAITVGITWISKLENLPRCKILNTIQQKESSEQHWKTILENMPVMLSAYDQNNHIFVQNEALKSSEARFRKIFAHAPIGMALIEPDGKLFQINQALCQMLGYTETELKLLNYSQINHPKNLEIESPYIQQICSGEISKYQLEKRYLKSNGEVVWAKVNCGLLRDLDGKISYRLAMIENITERRLIEQMKDSFISIVSHELRSPITSIHGVLSLLATERLGVLGEEGQELVDIALTESQRLIRLIGNILDLERIRSGHITLLKEVYQASNLMMQAVDRIQPIAKKAEVEIIVPVTQEGVWVDPDRMLQLLTNLLDNAIKFSQPDSKIWLSVQRIGVEQPCLNELYSSMTEQILFAIKDQGRGIPTDKLETIFEPFEQVDTSDTRRKGGTGLGLAICRSIVLAHGGKIWAESTLSEGSTFYFTLPLPPEELNVNR